MSEVEGAILGWAGWAVDSKLWRHLDEAREVLRSRAGREAARGARKRLRASVDPSRPAIGEAQSILDADASIHDARSGNLLVRDGEAGAGSGETRRGNRPVPPLPYPPPRSWNPVRRGRRRRRAPALCPPPTWPRRPCYLRRTLPCLA